ncbi:MAG TPA: sulfate ABC transporter substrate-binding protein [Pirellulales bacterium]
MTRTWILGLSLLALIGAGLVFARSGAAPEADPAAQRLELLNVSYDPTRELWRAINARFTAKYERETGHPLTIKQSHAGSGSQARAVIDGIDADVVTLALWSDMHAIELAGLISPGWEDRLPNRSLPYVSTIVFVVRKGNPKQIKDWSDLVRPGVEIITPSPKTSGNGKLAFLAAWGSVIARGGSQDEALRLVTQIYKQTPVLDSAARAATTTFAQKRIGDVHLTWENEAHLEVQESGGELEIVVPPVSILAEPPVAVVDVNAEHKGTSAAARQYLEYLYTDEGQEIIAQHYYRPINAVVLARHAFPRLELFTIEKVATNWQEATERFFGEGGVFDQIYSK